MPEKASDSGERKAIVSESLIKLLLYGLQTLGGILLMIVTGMCVRLYDRLESHEGRIIRIETRSEATDAFIREIRQDVKDIKEELKKRP